MKLLEYVFAGCYNEDLNAGLGGGPSNCSTILVVKFDSLLMLFIAQVCVCLFFSLLVSKLRHSQLYSLHFFLLFNSLFQLNKQF